MRKAYLDNVRWGTVLLVLVYHVCYLFNGLGIPGGIPGARSVPALDAFAGLVYPWFMALLFAVSGMCARYALQRRTAGQFLRERARKLLIPSTLGLFAVHWITGLMNLKMGGALGLIPPALLYPVAAVSGIGPLWFAQMLFLFSCLLAALRKLDRADRLWTLGGRAGLPAVLLLAVPIFGAAQVLNLPVLTMYRFGIYFAAYLIGYCVLSHEGVQDALARRCVPLLCLAALAGAAYALVCRGQDYTAPSCLRSPLTNLYLWMAVLAVLGCAKRFFNRESAFTRAMTRASYGVYVLHYPVLLAVCLALHTYFDLPALVNCGAALLAAAPLTFALERGVRRVPVLRTLVLGVGGPRRG